MYCIMTLERKNVAGTHYEALDMDWSPTVNNLNSASKLRSIPLVPNSTAMPFMFHTSSIPMAMQLDEEEPVQSTSTSVPIASPTSINTIQPREISSGAVQRERKKRDKLKEWQVASLTDLSSSRAYESDGEEDQEHDGGKELGNEDSPDFGSRIRTLLVRDRRTSCILKAIY